MKYPIKIGNLRDKNKQKQEGRSVRCDRYSALGNPFHLTKERDRDEVCQAYDVYFEGIMAQNLEPMQARSLAIYKYPSLTLANFWKEPSRQEFMTALNDLKEVNKQEQLRLMCWCSPKKCHCETIKSYLETGRVRF